MLSRIGECLVLRLHLSFFFFFSDPSLDYGQITGSSCEFREDLGVKG
jgi:hypothetical protein